MNKENSDFLLIRPIATPDCTELKERSILEAKLDDNR